MLLHVYEQGDYTVMNNKNCVHNEDTVVNRIQSVYFKLKTDRTYTDCLIHTGKSWLRSAQVSLCVHCSQSVTNIWHTYVLSDGRAY